MTHIISKDHLSLQRLKDILGNHERLELGAEAKAAIEKCRSYLDSKMEDISRPVYGITTGFGSLYNVTIPTDQLSQLQYNLVVSHACGTGETVRPEIVRLMLLLKAQSLSYGHSGAQLITVQRLLDMFNNDILPVVYQQGSLGASGDLAPLAHMSLPLIGLGEVLYKGRIRPSEEVWKEMGWDSIIYMAAIAAIDPTLYEAATVDGAGRMQQVFHVTLPSILSTIVILFILQVGRIMNAGFEQIFYMQNAAVRKVSDVLDTYIYTITFKATPNYGFSAAVGLFKSVINLFMLLLANFTVKKATGSGLFA